MYDIGSYVPASDVHVSRSPMPAGFQGTSTTVARIGRVIHAWSSSPVIRDLTEHITQDADDWDTYTQAVLIFQWTQRHIGYRRDPVGVELLKEPDVILKAIQARGKAFVDCDEFVAWLGSCLQSIGIPVRAKKVSFNHRPGSYQHIYLEAHVSHGFDGQRFWLPLDPTFPGAEPGKILIPGTKVYTVDWRDREDRLALGRLILFGVLVALGLSALKD